MEFGRPTLLLISENKTTLITPTMEKHMVEAMAKVDRLLFWNDGDGDEWRKPLDKSMNPHKRISYEQKKIPILVLDHIRSKKYDSMIPGGSELIEKLRMIKSAEELQLARHAGEVANTMMNAGRSAIKAGAKEYEVALAISEAGTRAAAEILERNYSDKRMSPNTHFLQIMSSGPDISMPHRRASIRTLEKGDPVFLCFCGMTNFHRFKLGFDRTFWISNPNNKKYIEGYELALESQKAAISKLKPGVAAEEIHAAYAEVIQDAGYTYPFRCGRATGFSFLEKPQIISGDKTIIKAGMVLAIDGSVTVDNHFRAQVGDSFIITDTGYEQITSHPNALDEIIL